MDDFTAIVDKNKDRLPRVNRELSLEELLKDKTPMTASQLKDVKKLSENVNRVSGVKILGGGSYIDPLDLPTAVTVHCDKFDLSIDEERMQYADTMTKLSVDNPAISFNFLEKVKTDDGRLIMYLSYTEYNKTTE